MVSFVTHEVGNYSICFVAFLTHQMLGNPRSGISVSKCQH